MVVMFPVFSRSNLKGLFTRKNAISTFLHYFSGALLYGIGLYIADNHYISPIENTTKNILFYIYLSYLAVAPIAFFFNAKKDISDHRPAVFFGAVFRAVAGVFGNVLGFLLNRKNRVWPALSSKEKNTVLFMLVKIFYIPLMLNFLVGNYRSLAGALDITAFFTLKGATYEGYAAILSFIFFLDVLFFCFGYLFEAGFLKNKLRSVEPTLLGWAVTLICYPPFNGMLSNAPSIIGESVSVFSAEAGDLLGAFFGTYFIGWSANDYIQFSGIGATFTARIAIVLALIVYLWATLSLGTKCSNLTNRGIVTNGAYKCVRHPAYVSKNLAWWITTIPVMSVPVFVTMSVWSYVYYLRAVTEERHLSKDPGYMEYRRKTKYMFVPYVI